MAGEISISKKIQKCSDSATFLITIDEIFRPLLISKSRVCPRLSVGPCVHAESHQKFLKCQIKWF